MGNMLYKSWIEDFHGFCGRVGGTTREVMSEFLSLGRTVGQSPSPSTA